MFHLTGHGEIQKGTPVTEDALGRVRYANAPGLGKAFGNRWPDLIVLSGCHTAQAPDEGMVPSMAHALVEGGTRGVLGWARPVYARQTGAGSLFRLAPAPDLSIRRRDARARNPAQNQATREAEPAAGTTPSVTNTNSRRPGWPT